MTICRNSDASNPCPSRGISVDGPEHRGYILAMPCSPDPIEGILGKEGALRKSLEGFECRPSQIAMARLILEAIETKQPAIVEAGTGTGKTLGYLVPLLLSGKRAVISTGTKNLQEQIYQKDIPLLASATGRRVDALLMKGRKNYLCLHRYHQLFSQASLLRPDLEETRRRLTEWLKQTEFADRGELPWIRDDDPLWDDLSASSDQCLGSRCLYWEDCYLAALRRRAARSQIIIVNHHLFFADLVVKKSGLGEILPPFQVVVFDEAHNLEEIATHYFGRRLSTRQVLDWARDLEKEMGNLEKTARKALSRSLDLVRTGVNQLSGCLPKENRGRLNPDALEKLAHGPVAMMIQGLRRIHQNSEWRSHRSNTFQACLFRAEEIHRSLEEILSFRDFNWLNWYERRKTNLVLHASPLDISSDMDELLYQETRTLVFTSATLSTKGNFDYFKSRMGLSGPLLSGIHPSHFDFENQTLLYVPTDLPLPSLPEFPRKAAKRILEILEITSGRALVLFTSHQNLNLAHEFLSGKLSYTVFKQGEAPKSVLLDDFRKDTHSVLLATGSFWQGVDVPGEALSCLIIDKLPFDSPGDPLVAARIDAIRARGGNPFMEYQLPSAIIALKQGLGRLIRNTSDRGVLCILDVRIIRSRYGHFFFESLPGMRVTHELADIGLLLKGSSGGGRMGEQTNKGRP
ncbi:MAG: ATP-dependent DNA helicase [Deltaproteobacteria bacterium]|nr:ATP-dependent DNA helicase [Deltaproteobacteria bacterium]